jgi:hypothetical protein
MPGLVCFCRLFRCLLLGLVVAIFPVVAGSAAAQGDLLVAPTRVVIANAGAGEVVLSNIGTAAATYRIGLELRRMNDAGDGALCAAAHHLAAGPTASRADRGAAPAGFAGR